MRGDVRVDRDTLEVVEIGGVEPSHAELTGTGDGRLFAFAEACAGSVLLRAELESVPLPDLPLTNAFAFWAVTSGSAGLFGGAGVSTCVSINPPG